MTSVLIADDHDVVRFGVRKILEAQPNCEVVAEACDGKEAIVKALETKPDVAVVDYSLPLINGIEVTRQIRTRLPKTEVLIFTMHDNDTLIHDALEAGARGYVVKSDARRNLVDAIQALASHKAFFTATISEVLHTALLAKRRDKKSFLTNRERGIVCLVAQGRTNKRIADALNISQKTVETHRLHINRKLNTSSAAGVVRYAIRNRLVEA